MIQTSLLVIVCGVAVASAWSVLPLRARGGRAWEEFHKPESSLKYTVASTYTQLLDHQNSSAGTFPQRYYTDMTYWDRDNGPLLLYIGGEGPLDNAPSGYMRNLARSFSAGIVALEHRFYGESVPGDDFSVSNLRFLTVNQALDDLAAFIDWFREEEGVQEHQKFINVGGSYPGALSAWFRIRHPDHSVGAIASSGVVNAIENFPEFDAHIAKALGSDVPSTCLPTLRATTAAFSEALDAGGQARDDAMKLFGDGVESLEDPDFYYMLADSSAMAVQYGHKDKLCEALQPSSDKHVLRTQFADFTNDFWGSDFGSNCFYDTHCLQNASQSDRWQPTSRAWRWQKCYELAYFQVAPATGSIRSDKVTLQYHKDQCAAIFGLDMSQYPTVDAINQQFGGAEPPAENTFFSQGSDDPWLEAGVVESLGPTRPAFVANCALCGHCKDLASPKSKDPRPVLHQRQLEAAFVEDWLHGK